MELGMSYLSKTRQYDANLPRIQTQSYHPLMKNDPTLG